MSKKLLSKLFVLLLVVGLLFAVAPTGQAQAASVVKTEAELTTALADPAVTEIQLGANIALTSTAYVTRAGVSIDGGGFTITGPSVYHGIDVTGDNVTISNMTITGSAKSNLQFYRVTGGVVTNVVLSNAVEAGMIVNGSQVTITSVSTINNLWGGINVDQGSGVTEIPLLTVTNVTTHISPTGRITPAIWVDDGIASYVSGEDGLYTGLTAPALLYYDSAEFTAATVFNVRTGVKYLTIQAAIDAALAGDVIYVPAGTYAEDVIVAKALALLGAGRDLVTIQGQLTGEAAALEIKADDVTIDGFKIIGAVGGKKTVRITTATDGLQFLNNRVVTASNTGGENAWSGFEVTYGTEQTNHVIDNNIFVGNGTSQLVYYGQNATNIKFTNNTITGTMMTGGLVAGFEGLNGSQVISGNTFDIESTYALFEAYGTYDIVAIFNANTWPAGYIATSNKVAPASVVYPSTNDINRTNGWAHVNFISADAVARTMTFEFVQPRGILSCIEYRTSAETGPYYPIETNPNPNPLILDGRYRYTCQNGVGVQTITITLEPTATYVEFRSPFGAESDERFYWTPFNFVPEVWVDDSFTGTEEGFGITKFLTIQEGIEAVATGGTVHVAAGTYVENVLVDKQVSIIGAGSGTDGTIVTTPAGFDTKVGVFQITGSGTSGAPLLLQNMRVEPVGQSGVSVGRFTESTGLNVSYLTLDNIYVSGSYYAPATEQERGFYVDLTSTVDHLTVTDSVFTRLTYGWYLQKAVSADTSTVSNVSVSNTTFSFNAHKGFYAEKLTDAVFTNCTFDNNGSDDTVLPVYFNDWKAGVDINLKAGAYSDISFIDCNITNNGTGNAKEGVGIAIKARTDGATYGPFPATLTGVLIQGGTITGNERGVRLGEPGKSNAGPTNVVITGVELYGNVKTYSGSDGSAYGDVVNQSLATVAATPNWWNHTTGPAAGQIYGDAIYVPWCLDATCKTLGYPPVHNTTQGTYFNTIQAAINAADANDAITVAAGTYLENITVNKTLTLTGAGRDLVTIQGSNLAQDGVFNITADDVTVEGFTIKGAGYKTVRVSGVNNRLTFKNNKVIAAANTTKANGWSAFETDYNQLCTGHVVTGNIFVGNGTAQLVYYNHNTGITFTGNTFEGTTVDNMNYGPVLGFDGLDGTQTISGNTFNVKRSGGDQRYSVYALIEAFGTYDLEAIRAANIFQYEGVAQDTVVFTNKIRPAYQYNSTNELNKAKQTPGHIGENAPYVELVSVSIPAKTITLRFNNPTIYNVGFEVRVDGEATTRPNDAHYNPWLPDYLYRVVYPNNGTYDITRTYTVNEYLEVRSTFGQERDFDFDWTRFEFLGEIYVDDSFTGTEEGFGVRRFSSLQAAIDAALPYATIRVAAGTYQEAVVVDKAVNLYGPNMDVDPNGTVDRGPEAIILGSTTAPAMSTLFELDAENVVVKGFTFDNVRINNYIDGGATGTLTNQFGGVDISNNIFTYVSGTAVYLRDGRNAPGEYSADVTVQNNLFNAISSAGGVDYNAGSAVIVMGAENLLVDGNVIVSAAYNGIQLARNNNVTVSNNTAVAAQPAIQIAQWNEGTQTISGNDLQTSHASKAAMRFYAFTADRTPSFVIENNVIHESVNGIQIGHGDAGKGDDISTADYSFAGNTFTDITGHELVVYLPAEATADQLTEMVEDFRQVYDAGAYVKEINGVDPYTYVVNYAPVAEDIAVTTPEDTAIDITLLGSDVDGDTLTYAIEDEPANGTVTLVGNVATYTPNQDYNGTDSFTYKVNDGDLDSNIATVTITVTPVNDAPVAVDDEYTVAEDTVLTVAAPGVLENDYDVDGDVLNVALRTNVSHGVLVLLSDGSFTYTPDQDFFGTDSFTYTLLSHPQPDSGWTDWATVTITVTPVNDAPVLDEIPDFTIPELEPFTFTAFATDVDDTELIFSLVDPVEGAEIDPETGVFTWTPTHDQIGEHEFTLCVSDGELEDCQTFTITVIAVNASPIAVEDEYTLNQDTILVVDAPGVLENDSDPEDDELTAVLVTTTQHGTLILSADGSFMYVPDAGYSGEDTFTYKAFDGEYYSEEVTVTLIIVKKPVWKITFPIIRK